MNINETITALFEKDNVIELLTARTEQKVMFVQAKQLVTTARTGRMNVVHQAEGENFVECLEQLKKQIAHTNAIAYDNMITLPRANGR